MANREPEHLAFCKAIVQDECPHLKGNEKCGEDKCIYNYKWVEYWVRFGHLPEV